MHLTTAEAMGLLQNVGEQYRRARDAERAMAAVRDRLLVELDGQEGMGRTQMAEALGLHRSVVHLVLRRSAGSPEVEQTAEAPEVPDRIAEAVREVFTATDGPVMGNLRAERFRADPTLRIDA